MRKTPEDSPAGTYQAAAAVHAAAIGFSRSGTNFPRPADSHATLGELIDVQQHLMKALHGLGRWHQNVRAGTDCADDKQSIDGVLEAAFQLQAALEHATALHQALIRAHHAGAQIRWCNPDGGKDPGDDTRPG